MITAKTLLFIIDGLPGGGAEKVVLTLSGALATLGHDVTLISLSPVCDYTIPDSVHFIVLEDRYRGPLHRQWEITRRAKQLTRALDKHFGTRKIDLAVSHLPKTDRIVAACPRLQSAWFCLHCALQDGILRDKTGIKRWIKQRQLKKTYSDRQLLTVCETLQQDVLACGIQPARMKTIYNPFDFEAIIQQSQAPCRWENEPFLLHVGRFNAQKRHDRLLEAFALSGYHGKLVLLGKGTASATQTVKNQAHQLGIAERVIFEGFCQNPYPYMRAAQALVLSSDYEGFGNVLVEALICGTPVISTHCPEGPAEILTGNLSCCLCDCNAQSLSATINTVLARPPFIDQAQLQRFSLNNTIQHYLSLSNH